MDYPPRAPRDTEPNRSRAPASDSLRADADAARLSEPIVGVDVQTQTIIGAAIDVHRELGNGFLEPVYQDALSIEFARRAVPFEREVALSIAYKGVPLTTTYRADFVC